MSDETKVRKSELPIVYSCSGCSSAAQMANYLAIQLDRRGVAQMSCIAGVGGDVPSLVKVATSGRPIIGIDGCPLSCVTSALARHGVEPTAHYALQEFKVKKVFGLDFDKEQAEQVLDEMIPTLPVERAMAAAP